jgi:hypothetical protein
MSKFRSRTTGRAIGRGRVGTVPIIAIAERRHNVRIAKLTFWVVALVGWPTIAVIAYGVLGPTGPHKLLAGFIGSLTALALAVVTSLVVLAWPVLRVLWHWAAEITLGAILLTGYLALVQVVTYPLALAILAGDWFGWANAVISDLVPLGVGLEVRRRRRLGLPIGAYPIVIILSAACLSLAGQLAEAKPSPSGWLLAAVPALGFLALTKLILSRPTTPTTSTAPAAEQAAAAPSTPATVVASTTVTPDMDIDTSPQGADPAPAVPVGLLPGARTIASSHRQVTGQTITPTLLAERMNVSADVADRILAALGEHTDRPTITTAHNGRPYAGAGR